MTRRSEHELRPSRGAIVVQLFGFIRKELLEIFRQPRLVVVMVLGPFAVLALFAAGFDQEQTVLRTAFVGPVDGPYESSVEEFAEELDRYVDNAGYSSDLVAASASLRSGDIDLIVVFPNDPTESILSGERAVIDVLHDKIDPIAQTAVEVSAQVAVQELNATILETVIGEAQSSLVPLTTSVDDANMLTEELKAAIAAGNESDVAATIEELDVVADAMTDISNVSESLALRLDASPEQRSAFEELSSSTAEFQATVAEWAASSDQISESDVDDVRGLVSTVAENGELVTTLDPGVIVRPFESDTVNLQRERIEVEDFFAPASIALLLQHMVLTFAALSLVSDRALGLFELFRVGPLTAGRVIVGKFASFAIIGAVIAAGLITVMKLGLDVPMRGSFGWLTFGAAGLLIASIALGTVISLLARSDTQAIQYALLALLAGLFFSGFFLDLDTFRYPFKVVSWLLPVTYGTNIFRDVMLRGNTPDIADLLGLSAVAVAYTAASWMLLERRLRVR